MVETRGIRTEWELLEATRLSLEVFGGDGVEASVQRKVRRILAHPSYHPEHVRVRVADGRIVAHLVVIERVMRVGAAEWRMGGIGGVCTAPDYRHQGHATALLKDALEFMREAGMDVTLLQGISNFYNRLGYAVVWPETYLSIPLADARDLPADRAYTIRPVAKRDIPALARLYDEAWRLRPGALVRKKEHWRWFLETSSPMWLAVGRKRRVQGYIVASGHAPNEVIELVAANAGSAYALVRHVAEVTPQDVEEMRILAARDDPLVSWLRRACRVKVVERTVPTGGWMARFVNLISAMRKLQDELSARFLRSQMQDWRGRVNLVTDLGTVGLFCRYGRVVVKEVEPTAGMTCRIPQDRLMQLILGFRTIYDVAEDPDVSVPEVARPLLHTLFPPTASYIAGLDRF